MTENKSFKRRVRERMAKTDESYTAARSHVAGKRDRVQAAQTRLAAAEADRPSDESLTAATGQTWDAWFALLDDWGAVDRKHGEVARFLVEEHDVPGWWAQSITVYYERARGLRAKHQRPDGFSVSASKTIAVGIDELSRAFVDDDERRAWLDDAPLALRTSRPGSARFDWDDGSTRVNVWFTEKGPSKTQVALAHERIADADDAEQLKAMWRERLAELKSRMES